MKFLKQRGDWYHFERVISKPLQGVMGKTGWREALNTDSKVEAEARCRRRTVETDEEIRKAKEGTYRLLSDTQVEDIAVQWGTDFQLINRENIARDAFPDVWGELAPVGDEAPRPIIRKKTDLIQYVSDWLERTEQAEIKIGTPDFEALLDACLVEYLVSNPEISSEWEDVLAEHNVLPKNHGKSIQGTLKRKKKVDPDRKLSALFKNYLENSPDLGESARSDFGTAVRRFIEFHGDIDVEEIDRTHAEKFRDGMKRMPVRPPNKIRDLSMPKQIAWADVNPTKNPQQGTINKNLQGVKLALDFAYEETGLIKNRNWRNPFEGFIKKVKSSKKDRAKGFTPEQVHIAFSEAAFQPKTVERFWIPVILYYTGARLDEIAQLHVSDVKLTPIPYLRAENLEDDNPVLAKMLKTGTSHRTIPIHADLIDMGLLTYAEAIREKGHTYLFPNLPHKRGRNRGGYVSRTFMDGFRGYGELNPDTGLGTQTLRTHSLRHTYRKAGYKVPDQDFVKIVMGHYVEGDSVQTYSWEIYNTPDVLFERVTKHVQLPPLDMPYLKGLADSFLRSLRTSS